jgi:hypothetical protein
MFTTSSRRANFRSRRKLMQTLKLLWFENELRILTRNTIIDVLVKKHDRRERLWGRIEGLLRFSPRKALEPQGAAEGSSPRVKG